MPISRSETKWGSAGPSGAKEIVASNRREEVGHVPGRPPLFFVGGASGGEHRVRITGEEQRKEIGAVPVHPRNGEKVH